MWARPRAPPLPSTSDTVVGCATICLVDWRRGATPPPGPDPDVRGASDQCPLWDTWRTLRIDFNDEYGIEPRCPRGGSRGFSELRSRTRRERRANATGGQRGDDS